MLFVVCVGAEQFEYGIQLGLDDPNMVSFEGEKGDINYQTFTETSGLASGFEQYTDGGRIVVNQGDLKIKGFDFNNLVKSSDGNPSEFIIDGEGNIKEAKFNVGEGGGNYLIAGTQFDAPAGSNVQFKDGIITMNVPEGSLVKSLPLASTDSEFILKGKIVEFTDFGVHRLDDGELIIKSVSDDQGIVTPNYYVKDAMIDGIKVTGQPDVRTKDPVLTQVFFDGKEHGTETSYISLQDVNNPESKVYINVARFKGGFDMTAIDGTRYAFNDNGAYNYEMSTRGGNAFDTYSIVSVKPESKDVLFSMSTATQELLVKGDGNEYIRPKFTFLDDESALDEPFEEQGVVYNFEPIDLRSKDNEPLIIKDDGYSHGMIESSPITVQVIEKKYDIQVEPALPGESYGSLYLMDSIIRDVLPQNKIDNAVVVDENVFSEACGGLVEGTSCIQDKTLMINSAEIGKKFKH